MKTASPLHWWPLCQMCWKVTFDELLRSSSCEVWKAPIAFDSINQLFNLIPCCFTFSSWILISSRLPKDWQFRLNNWYSERLPSWRQNIADSDQNTCCCEKLRHHQGFYIRDDCALENQMNFQNTIIPKGWNSFVDISDISADHKLHLLSRSNISDPLGRPTSWLLWYLSQCWSTSDFVLCRIAM